ncbi:putative rhamnosyltransferase [Cereibacter changlensis]|uniref:Putative rhamnosyltransferase n=3 Tax=Cereibacter changlensis TaxID=402884 RepID=A0A2W7R5V5_9RHOB|nr:glycosyltransferase [Cereibacter changlensis]PZX56228.1 putative rhamnosyltransferase [Cereibacter changlensis]
MQVVGICRFSLLGKGDWKTFATPDQTPDAAFLEAQAKALFAPDRLEARLKSFEHITLASLAAQTDPGFTFIVLASKLMPPDYRRRLKALCAAAPQVCLRFFEPVTAYAAQRRVFRELELSYPDVLQFRLDDDDGLCIDFIERMKAAADSAAPEHEIFTLSMRGVMFCSSGGAAPGTYHWPVDFMSAGAAIRHPSKSIYQFGHFGMAQRFPAIVLTGGMALVSHNGTNDTAFNAHVVRKRAMELMGPQEAEEAIARHFPFLSTTAKRLIGYEKAEDDETKPPAPRWLADLMTTKHRKGFFISGDSFALQHTHRGSTTLYVTFDNLSSVRAPSRLRDPWGYGFAEKQGWSGLGVLSYRPNWFRDDSLISELEKLSASGFFAEFRKVVFCGTSMGGYAACAFASLAPGCTVIAFSPQSTLDRSLAGWDERYRTGSAADWTGPYADAAREIRSAGRAFIIHDRQVAEDRRHADRLDGDNALLLNARHSGHFTAQFLSQIGILPDVVRAAESGELDSARFYALYRRARDYRRYLLGVTARVQEHPSARLKDRLHEVLAARNKLGLAKDLHPASLES